MKACGRRDDDGIEIRVGEEIRDVGVRAFNVELAGETGRSPWRGISDGDELGVDEPARNSLTVEGTDAAGADEADIDGYVLGHGIDPVRLKMSDGECGAERFERRFRVAGGPGFHPDRAGIAHRIQRLGDAFQLTSPVPGWQRPGTSATWISPIQGRHLRQSSIRFPSPIWA